jgi:hypothetical protein
MGAFLVLLWCSARDGALPRIPVVPGSADLIPVKGRKNSRQALLREFARKPLI